MGPDRRPGIGPDTSISAADRSPKGKRKEVLWGVRALVCAGVLSIAGLAAADSPLNSPECGEVALGVITDAMASGLIETKDIGEDLPLEVADEYRAEILECAMQGIDGTIESRDTDKN